MTSWKPPKITQHLLVDEAPCVDTLGATAFGQSGLPKAREKAQVVGALGSTSTKIAKLMDSIV